MVTSSFTQLLNSDEFRKRGLKGIKGGRGGGGSFNFHGSRKGSSSERVVVKKKGDLLSRVYFHGNRRGNISERVLLKEAGVALTGS